MARIFLSHASTDRDKAAEVHNWLKEQGHEVFLSFDHGDGILLGLGKRAEAGEVLRLHRVDGEEAGHGTLRLLLGYSTIGSGAARVEARGESERFGRSGVTGERSGRAWQSGADFALHPPSEALHREPKGRSGTSITPLTTGSA